MKHIHKVFAYATNRQGLLVFVHPRHPETGIQVPPGTLDSGESPEAGVLREVREETGLTGSALGQFLGEQERDLTEYNRAEIRLCRFYHVLCSGAPTDTWRHFERDSSENPEEPIPFDCFSTFSSAPGSANISTKSRKPLSPIYQYVLLIR